MDNTYRGSCHCGEVRFEVSGTPEEFTTCDCSICKKKNALMWKVPEDKLRILNGQRVLTLYQWNTHTAKHYFCSICGIYTFHRKRMAPDHFGVNVFCLEGLNTEGVPVRDTGGSALSTAQNED